MTLFGHILSWVMLLTGLSVLGWMVLGDRAVDPLEEDDEAREASWESIVQLERDERAQMAFDQLRSESV